MSANSWPNMIFMNGFGNNFKFVAVAKKIKGTTHNRRKSSRLIKSLVV